MLSIIEYLSLYFPLILLNSPNSALSLTHVCPSNKPHCPTHLLFFILCVSVHAVCVFAWGKGLRRQAIGLLVDSAAYWAHCAQKALQPSWTQQEARTLFQMLHLLSHPLPPFSFYSTPPPTHTHTHPTLTPSNPRLTPFFSANVNPLSLFTAKACWPNQNNTWDRFFRGTNDLLFKSNILEQKLSQSIKSTSMDHSL